MQEYLTMIKKMFQEPSGTVANQLNAIIDQSFDGIFITDKHATVLRCNHAYEFITGLKKEELIGKNMADLVRNGLISQSGSLYVSQKKKLPFNNALKQAVKHSLRVRPFSIRPEI